MPRIGEVFQPAGAMLYRRRGLGDCCHFLEEISISMLLGLHFARF